jgi:uncharacterized SAM-binding protein YcdF (DUF218 family)
MQWNEFGKMMDRWILNAILRKQNLALRLRLFFGVSCALALLTTATGLVILLGVGKWLVREDRLQPATAIAVLSGNMPSRALEAAALYRQGYAREIWLTHPGFTSDALRVFGISYPSEDDFNIRVLRRQGVPGKAIRVLDAPIVNTAQELDVISSALQTRGGQKVIIVTSLAHTRRVHILWTKYFTSRGDAIVHAVSDDQFAADHWWKNSGDMSQVTHEVLGILNAWADLPVQPGPRPTDAMVAGESNNREHASAD